MLCKIFFLGALLCLQGRVFAQAPSDSTGTSRGIHFERGLDWDQLLDNAKAGGKEVFIDCYASWCGPCKNMDKYVYSEGSVGEFANPRFISVKVQFDTASTDDSQIRSLYGLAKELQTRYGIYSFPSYLFFAPDGRIVHREIGSMGAEDFIRLLATAQDTGRGYYALIRKYDKGDDVYSEVPGIINIARKIKDNRRAERMREDFVDHYLLEHRDQFLRKENMVFALYNLKGTKDPAFPLVAAYSDTIDKLMGKHFSMDCIDYQVYRDYMIAQYPAPRQMPNWDSCSQAIRTAFGREEADRVLATAKANYYLGIGDYPNYTHYLVEKVEKCGAYGGFGITFNLNNDAWDIFLHSSKKDELEQACKWCLEAIHGDPKYVNTYDTYANLLYKCGRLKDAIVWENRAIALDPKEKSFPDTLEKMKTGRKTWPEN